MDLLVLSDIHDKWTHLEKMISLASELDGVVFLGDLLVHGSFEKYEPIAFRNLSKIHDAAKFTVGIPGNSATPEEIQFLDGIDFNVHGKSNLLNDVGFFGVGGTPNTVGLVLELREFFKREIHPAIELHEKALETLSVFGVKIRD
ncbi:MAG: metallophosphoesterase, partial [Candidatus Thorarchaeota archaeon]|nr:metallophosphoesterase [Candidatus Thorarchaeota archaeon]